MFKLNSSVFIYGMAEVGNVMYLDTVLIVVLR